MDAVDEPEVDAFASSPLDPLALSVKEELDPLALAVKEEKPDEVQKLLQQDFKISDLQACRYQYERPLEVLVDFEQDEKPSVLPHPPVDPLAHFFKEEKPTDLRACFEREEKPNLQHIICKQERKPAELLVNLQPYDMHFEQRPDCDVSLPEVETVTCASCAMEFSCKKMLRRHFIGSNFLKFCGKLFELNQPFVKLVRLKETIEKTGAFVVKVTEPGSRKYVKKTKGTSNSEKQQEPRNLASRAPNRSREELGSVFDVFKKKFISKQKLATHMLEHADEQSVSLKIVGKDFTKKPTISKHVSKTAKTVATHGCSVCTKEFGRKSSLLQHMRLHVRKQAVSHSESKQDSIDNLSNKHIKISRTYDCDVCMKVVNGKKSLVEHMLIHSANLSSSWNINSTTSITKQDISNPRKHSGASSIYLCDFCKIELRSKRALEHHLLSHKVVLPFSCKDRSKACATSLTSRACNRTVSISKYVCDVCKKEFPRRRRLIGHLRSHEKRLYSCTLCPATFTSSHDNYVHSTKSTHPCVVCHKEIQGKYALKTHMKRHAGERPISCAVCAETFFTKPELIMHLRKHAGHTQPIVCDVCGKDFCNNGTLLNHMRLHSGERPYACSHCPKTFVSQGCLITHVHQHETSFYCDVCKKKLSCKSSLVLHMRIHTGERPFACKVCPEMFPTHDQLAAHARQHPGAVPTHVCEFCKKELSTKKNLKSHMRLHTGRPYACTVCSKAYTTQGHLSQHTQNKHGDKSFICDICKKKFVGQLKLQQHLRLHTGERPYSCTVCAKTYITKEQLKAHTNRKHSGGNTNLVCSICNKQLCNKYNLKQHMRIHTGERPYPCADCPMAFIAKSDLTIHERKHNGVTFDCDICKKSMITKSNLAEHMRKHTGDLPFACTICPKAFTRPDLLAKHVVQHSNPRPMGPHVCGICKRGLSSKPTLKRHMRLCHGKGQAK